MFLFLLPSFLFSQIEIDKAGDGWDLKIDSAIQLIKKTDFEKYKLLDSFCDRVSFWLSPFSSISSTKEEGNIIFVAVKDVKLNSINNLAVVLVHESLHLYVAENGIILPEEDEEKYCYRYELQFIEKLSNPEPWLKQHAIKQLTKLQ